MISNPLIAAILIITVISLAAGTQSGVSKQTPRISSPPLQPCKKTHIEENKDLAPHIKREVHNQLTFYLIHSWYRRDT